MKVFLLQHSYEYEILTSVNVDETKVIGIYSSKEKAEKTIEEYKEKQGFSRFPVSCFFIDEYVLDKNHWEDGFVTWDSEIDDWVDK